MTLKLIIGLGNPGPDYTHTRHNAGVWLIESLLQKSATSLKEEKKLQAKIASIQLCQSPCLVGVPSCFMNASGLSVRMMVQYYRIEPTSVLIVHDELDLPVGSVKLKAEGGHGGHNGLRDIIQHLGTTHFYRLRIGIGHPKQREAVEHYVLNAPSRSDKLLIEESILRAMDILPLAIEGKWAQAMQELHT